jgi:hypothetical protein
MKYRAPVVRETDPSPIGIGNSHFCITKARTEVKHWMATYLPHPVTSASASAPQTTGISQSIQIVSSWS